ncbi:YqhG family protein [Paenibacillus xerothermodurans]|uniref:Uncharacterized protein n=1 Tax=Paenibacillus xerothermodurans TaxID=1977292 RepID=A0A2W1NN48_PAEXE|nr:YqhG family protein [Paenibacillus xerothermodurans]PZE20915.1 hypothetical protein CBW46_009485 [Paenibacillus xerothermodurans]
MNSAQIRQFVMRYLEAEQCDVIDKHPAYVTVKLSPSADRELTFRPYYWNFVEATGAPAETMTFTFIFDPEGHNAATQAAGRPGVDRLGMPLQMNPVGTPGAGGPGAPHAAATQPHAGGPPTPGVGPASSGAPSAAPGSHAHGTAGAHAAGHEPAGSGAVSAGSPAGQPAQPDGILSQYFGFVPTQVVPRIPKDEVTFGSQRLEQIFGIVRNKGRYVHLYEQFQPEQKSAATVPYDNWFQVNFKVELACDMKRSELHSLGIHLVTGEIREHFQELLQRKSLTPRLPAQVFIVPDRIALPRAVIYLEEYLENKFKTYDQTWAAEAALRLEDELARVRGYYETLIQNAEPDARPEVEAQYANRKHELEWQYRPRIQISVINCGLFHLRLESKPNN